MALIISPNEKGKSNGPQITQPINTLHFVFAFAI